MNKKTWIIVGAIVLAFAGMLALSWSSRGGKRVETVSYEDYDLNKVIPADEQSGGLTENIKGNPNAPILIFEYADYQCEGCASMNPSLNTLVEEYDGKVAVVYRGYVLSYHQNGTAAASAANAAAIQGYWVEFKDLLFSNQNEWYSASASERQTLFENYFMQASGNKGNLAQFRNDMASDEVAQKIEFDRGLAEIVGLEWTPTIVFDGEVVSREEMSDFLNVMRKKIDAKLKELGKN